jgi:hypothetical protein
VVDLLLALEGSILAGALRHGRWSYAAVNTTHVLGVALVVGPLVALDLRLLGLWRTRVAVAPLARVLAPLAAGGFVLAATAGLLLFATRASEYALLPVLWLKLGLIATGIISAGVAVWRHGADLANAADVELRLIGAVSLACWVGALVCGRLIAFTGS